MRREDVQKLLGGYAAGTLTPEERRILFEAALDDPELFAALAEEQALRDTLDDPRCRREVLEALEEHRAPWRAWLLRPWPWAAAGAVACTVVLVFALVRWNTRERFELAQARKEVAAPQAQPGGTSYSRQAPAPSAVPEKHAPSARKKLSEGESKGGGEPAASPRAEWRPTESKRKLADTAERDLGARADKPAQPALQAEAREAQAAGAPADTARASGGVVGGVTAAAPAPPAPARQAEPQSADVRAQALPPAPGEKTETVAKARAAEQAPAERANVAGVRDEEAVTAARRARAASVVTPPLQVRYRILRRSPDGVFEPADATAAFRRDEPLRLSIEPGGRAHYYLVAGNRLLASGLSGANEARVVPLPAGTERLVLVASPEPVANPVELALRSSRESAEGVRAQVSPTGLRGMAVSSAYAEVPRTITEIRIRYE